MVRIFIGTRNYSLPICWYKFNLASILIDFTKHYTKKMRKLHKSVDILRQTCYQQADIRMRWHGLRQLVDNKSVASCGQTYCKLIVKTCCPKAWYKLFQQFVTSLQMTSYNLLQLDETDVFGGTCSQKASSDKSA